MQTINLDVSIKTPVPILYVKQKNVGSKFTVRIFENSAALIVDKNSFSVWYSGASGDGNYSTIDGETAFFIDGNEVVVEMITQMVNVPGMHEMCLIMKDADGNQTGFWNIPYYVEAIPGADSEEATQYFNELAGAAKIAKESQIAAGLLAARAERAAESVENPVSYKPQELTEEEKKQARENIGAVGIGEVVVAESDELSDRYDLKDGYEYTPDVYIATDGTETTLTGKNFKCVDYVPVKAGTSYAMFGVGYALYDTSKTFLSAVIDTTGVNGMKSITPTADGFVRLTIASDDIGYARFCRKSEVNRELREYLPAPNPFFDPCRPCDVHLYGDSNSEGYGLADTSKSWANLLGVLITGLPDTVTHTRLSGFAEKEKNNPCMILKNGSSARLTAYTSEFTICGVDDDFYGFFIAIDGQYVGAMQKDNSSFVNNKGWTKTYTVPEGYHTLDISGGLSGKNMLHFVTTKKSRTFTNHAVFGNYSFARPMVPDGSIDIVMLGTNDRMLYHGMTYDFIWDFYRKCKEMDIVPYIFTPIPTDTTGEENAAYLQAIGDVIAQLPPDSINVYKDLQMVDVLTGETIFSDNLHLNERGHKLLYAIAASKIGLAALSSEIGKSTVFGNIEAVCDNIIAKQESLIEGGAV